MNGVNIQVVRSAREEPALFIMFTCSTQNFCSRCTSIGHKSLTKYNDRLTASLVTCLPVCLVACLPNDLLARSLYCLLARLLAFFLSCLLVRFLARLLACLLESKVKSHTHFLNISQSAVNNTER